MRLGLAPPSFLCALLCSHLLQVAVQCKKEENGPILVEWLWMGGLTSTSLSFRVGLYDTPSYPDDVANFMFVKVRSLTDQDERKKNFASALSSTRRVVQFDLLDLDPGDEYEYTLRLESTILRSGTFRTPPDGPFEFTVAFGSCMDQKSDPKVFESIRQNDPLFFIHTGDLHYENIDQDDTQVFANAYHSILTSPAGRAMLNMNISIAYMWDDHDFGPDNCDRMAPGRRAALEAYRQYVPHFSLDNAKENAQDDEARRGGSIHQMYKIGSVLFLMTDLRSQRTPNASPDTAEKTVLGEYQKKWMMDKILQSIDDTSPISCIVWVNTIPWIDQERKWGHFKTEQQQLVDFLTEHDVMRQVKLYIISGDAHMLAVDDGSNSPGAIPVFHAAALGREGTIKGGPYSHGAFPGSGQFGLLHITEDEDTGETCVKYSGRNIDNQVVLEYDACEPESTPGVPYTPPPILVRKIKRMTKKMYKRTKKVLNIQSDSVLFGLVMALAVLLAAFVQMQSAKPGKAPTRRKKKD